MNQKSVAQWFCARRKSWPWKVIGEYSYLVNRAYENRNFDMQHNGEAWYLSRLINLKDGVKCVFDIGANHGDWLQNCRKYCPNAAFHEFEIAPKTFQTLKANTAGLQNVILNPIGLSDQAGEIQIHFSEEDSGQTSFYKEHLDPAYRQGWHNAIPSTSFTAKVMRGDDYVSEHRIQAIDAMKIDVEGMEEKVLSGFSQTLADQKIRLIQFEYNTINIISKFLLRDAYHLFGQYGYILGKLYPNYVDFRDYHYSHENFCGPNYIAIKKNDPELLNLLQGNTP